MTDTMRLMIETGKRGKWSVAVAPEWPGLAQGHDGARLADDGHGSAWHDAWQCLTAACVAR